MALCRRCGADIAQDGRFCPYCGHETAADEGRHESGGYQGNYDRGGYSEYGAPGFDPRDIEDNRVISLLCYLSLLLLIPLLLRPYSSYVRFHANQGILLLIVSIISGAAGAVPIIGWLASLVGGIFCLVCMILGIINSINGQARPLPIIGSYTILK